MNGELICVGTELLLGDILNTNAQYLSRELAALGIDLYHQSVVGDNAARLEALLREALLRSELVLLTGGLGPTDDDLTKETVAKVLDLPLEPHAESLRRIEAYFARTGRTMTESNRKQALCPRGATVLPNAVGTAPGYCIPHGHQTVLLLPGPPHEMQTMFETHVRPLLKAFTDSVILSRAVQVFGIGEAAMAERVRPLLSQKNPTVAPYAKDGEALLRVTAKGATQNEAAARCDETVAQIRALLGDAVYGVDEGGLNRVVVSLLKSRGMKIATAESCTGGLLSELFTEVPGASAVFEGGVSTYSPQIKQNWLGISDTLLAEKGTVDPTVAAEMARCVRECAGTTLGVGITGVAGPDPSEGKPVGLVYIALADQTQVWVRRILVGHGKDREQIRRYAALTALDLARRYLLSSGVLPGGTPHGQPVHVLQEQPAIARPQPAPTTPPAPAPVPPAGAPINDNQLFAIIQQSADDNYDPESDPLAVGPVDEQLAFLTDQEADEEAAVPADRPKIARLLPWKGDSVREICFKVLFLVSLITLLVSASWIATYFYTGHQQNGLLADVQALYQAQVEEHGDAVDENGVYQSFAELLAQNPDTTGWIRIPGTKIDYPVFQAADNDYYTTHNMLRRRTRFGSLFLDYRCAVEQTQISQNLVIYGHNLNDGSMFGSLKEYKSLDYYRAHPIIDFTTIYRKGDYKIFSIFLINTKKEDDNGARFPFETTSFVDEAHFDAFVREAQQRSLYRLPVDVNAKDEILTLVTCTYEFSDARLIVMARRVRGDETADVAVSEAALNANPRYPQAWYDKRGVENPYANEKTFPAFGDSASEPTESTEETSSAPTSSEPTSSEASSSDTPSGSSSTNRPQSSGGQNGNTNTPTPANPATTPSTNQTQNPSPQTPAPESSSSKPAETTSTEPTSTSSEAETPPESTASDAQGESDATAP